MATYQDYIKYFGSPEAYASAIKQKEASGQKLSDPAAAAAFKAAYPQYFSSGGGSSSGSSSSTKSGSGAGSSASKSSGTTYAPATRVTSPPGTFTITDAYGNPVTVPLLSQEQVDTLKTYLSQKGVSHSPDVIWSGPGQLSSQVYAVADLARQAQQAQQPAKTYTEEDVRQAFEQGRAQGAEEAKSWLQGQLGDLQQRFQSALASLPTLDAINARLQEAIQAVQPVSIQQPPTLQGITPAEDVQAAQPQEQPKSALPSTPGGFVQQAAALPYLPSVDKLYDLYKQVFGKEDEGIKAYLASPQFQGILSGGAVPMWMQADPLWRLYLARLGVLRRLGQAQ